MAESWVTRIRRVAAAVALGLVVGACSGGGTADSDGADDVEPGEEDAGVAEPDDDADASADEEDAAGGAGSGTASLVVGDRSWDFEVVECLFLPDSTPIAYIKGTSETEEGSYELIVTRAAAANDGTNDTIELRLDGEVVLSQGHTVGATGSPEVFVVAGETITGSEVDLLMRDPTEIVAGDLSAEC